MDKYLKHLGWLVLLLAPLALADRYRIDPTHTSAQFAVDHLGFSVQRGRFDRSSGTLELDLEAKTGKVQVSIEAASLFSGDAKRDQRLKGPSFFDVETYPLIEFSSTSFEWSGEYPTEVQGDLSLRGVTRPVVLSISRVKCGFHLFDLARACGADAQLTIKRSDFGMDSWLSSIGNDVDITLQVEAIHE